MNRSAKRHRSTKVPNVKLRPAPTGASSAKVDRRRLEQEAEKEDLTHYRRLREVHRTGKARAEDDMESDGDEEGTADADDDDKGPLLGCVICMTGITDEKDKLTESAVALGAQVQGNLTEDATHLIAKEPRSTKYHCALRLGLPILRTEWLQELRARWTGAIDYDFHGLMEEYRLDTFQNLVVGLAGIVEPSERTEIRKNLKSGSAKTPTTFALDGTFTHLVCGDIKDSKTMEYVTKQRRRAERFTRRGEDLPDDNEPHAREMKAALDLRIVWKEWVDDCMEVQGSIDEKHYSVDAPRPTAAQRRELRDAILYERGRQEQLLKERMAAFRRLQDASDTVVNLHARETPSTTGSSVDMQRVTKRPKLDLSAYVQRMRGAEDREADVSGKDRAPPATLSKAAHFEQKDDAGPANIQRLSCRNNSSHDIQPDVNSAFIITKERATQEEDTELEEDPLAGLSATLREKSLSLLTFRLDLREEDKNQAARKFLESRGVHNVLRADDPQAAHFRLLPLGKVEVPPASHLGIPVTRLFIERCLTESRVLNLHESFALQPAAVAFPLEGAGKVFVGLTGFAAEDDIDRKQAEIALQAAGIEVTSTLKKGYHTHLLTGKEATSSKSSQMKMQKAKEWGIQCVGLDFVQKVFTKGRIEPAVATTSKRATSNITSTTSVGQTQQGDGDSSTSLSRSTPLGVNRDVANVTTRKPWQRSTSASQALLDGEEARGIVARSPLYLPPESLEGASLAHKASAEDIMALLNSRRSGMGVEDLAAAGYLSSSSAASSSTRKKGRLPPSRLRERRAGSLVSSRDERMASENPPTAEEMLAMRQQEEERLEQLVEQTQTHPTSGAQQDDQSLRITYDDPISRRERRKMSDLIATSVKDREAQQQAAALSRGSSKEIDEEMVFARSSSSSSAHSVSPSKERVSRANFTPTVQARKQPGTRVYM